MGCEGVNSAKVDDCGGTMVGREKGCCPAGICTFV